VKNGWRKVNNMASTKSIILPFASLLLTACEYNNSKTAVHNSDTLHKAAKHAQLSKENLSPAEVLSTLKQGNRNFVMRLSPSNLVHDSSYNYFDQIKHTVNEQHPIACILTCMDSRVPPEIIFDQGIGSLFVIRIAGNIEDPDVLGSMEYAVAEKGVGVIIVMGHKNCGAISAAFSKIDPANKELVSLIAHVKMDIVPTDSPPYDASAKHNVKKTMDNILNGSKTIREKMMAGNLILVGALYNVADGSIDWNSNNW
jgi:carbonic anhydrase